MGVKTEVSAENDEHECHGLRAPNNFIIISVLIYIYTHIYYIFPFSLTVTLNFVELKIIIKQTGKGPFLVVESNYFNYC